MNERIKELILEAGFPKFDEIYVVTDGEELKKFAELVVRDCAKVLTQHRAYFSSGEGEPYRSAASLIEEHFGVK